MALKQAKYNVQIEANQFSPGRKQCIPDMKKGGKTLKQIPARQGNRVRCQTFSRGDG